MIKFKVGNHYLINEIGKLLTVVPIEIAILNISSSGRYILVEERYTENVTAYWEDITSFEILEDLGGKDSIPTPRKLPVGEYPKFEYHEYKVVEKFNNEPKFITPDNITCNTTVCPNCFKLVYREGV